MISMLIRGLTYVSVGFLIWMIGLTTALTEAGSLVPLNEFSPVSILNVLDFRGLPAFVFLVFFVVSWLRLVAPKRVGGNETKLLAIVSVVVFALLVSHISGRVQTQAGVDWAQGKPIVENLLWHALLFVPALFYLLIALNMNRSAAGDMNDGQRFEDGLHMSFQYQIFVPSVLFCTTFFSMGVLAAYTSADTSVPARALVYLFLLAACFTGLFKYAAGSRQGVALYLPFILASLLFAFAAAVWGGFLSSKLIVLAVSITFAMGVAEVAKRYGQVRLGRLSDYEVSDADYFLLGSNWASIVFPTLTLVIVTTFGGFTFLPAAVLIGVFVVSWLHLTPNGKSSIVGRSLSLLYGVMLPIFLAFGFLSFGQAGIAEINPLHEADLSNMSIVITLIGLTATLLAFMRLAKDTVGLSLTDFLDQIWEPENYLYRPQCLLLLLTVNSLYLVVLLCLFLGSLAIAGNNGPITQVGQNILGAGISVFVISIVGFIITFLTPGSNDRLKVEKKKNQERATDRGGSTPGTSRTIALFLVSGRPGVSWIAGFAAAATYYSSTGYVTFEVAAVFVVMTGLTMFGFVANDISDFAKDRAAKKNRPIATGELSLAIASALAAMFLAAIFVVSWFLGSEAFAASLVVASALIFYSPFSQWYPKLKGPYTAALCVSPFFVAHGVLETAVELSVIAIVFAFIVFRELLLDANDLETDRSFGLITLAAFIGRKRSETIGWIGMFSTFLLGIFFVDGWMQKLALASAIFVLGYALSKYRQDEIIAMKITRLAMLLGVVAAAT